jgi:hypothetical protein
VEWYQLIVGEFEEQAVTSSHTILLIQEIKKEKKKKDENTNVSLKNKKYHLRHMKLSSK